MRTLYPGLRSGALQFRDNGRRNTAAFRLGICRAREAGIEPENGDMAATADLAALGIDDFTPHLEATFELHAEAGAVPLRLAKADPAGNSGRPGGAFSLIFVAPKGPWLPQKIYPVTHPALGTMEIFLVPVGPAFGGNSYQAIFT
jgi:hypothetical protein